MKGQHTKPDDLTTQRIVAAVKKGLPLDTAASLAGVSPSTLSFWLKKGDEGDPNYSDIAERVRAAEAADEAELVSLIRKHAKSSWEACAWLLEHQPREPEVASTGSAATSSPGPRRRP